MKKHLPVNLEQYRVDHPGYVIAPEGSIEGAFIIPYGNKRLKVISGCGEGWDHVSVSLTHRCPTWDEMNWIKNQFFENEEMAIQLHPPRSIYINYGKYVLHLWRCWDQEIKVPPRWTMVPD